MTDLEHRLDELSRAVADGRTTRRGVLKAGFAFAGAALAATLPGRARAADGQGSSDCAHYCNQFPPGQRDDCLHACKAAPCFSNPANICPGSNPVTCCPPDFGGPASCCGGGNVGLRCCNVPAGQLCCPTLGRCLKRCTPPRVPDLVNCRCVCPPETRECTPGGTCCPTAQECCGDVCCPTGQTCQDGACVAGLACQPGNVCDAHFVCDQFPPVNGHECRCFGTSEGTCLCARNSSCFDKPLCDSPGDCPAGSVCVTNHGCPFPQGICLAVCVPGQAGAVQSLELSGVSPAPSGPTAADVA